MISIAIDGPAGAGKSSLARAAAGKLGFIYVDTGALYRTIALKFVKTETDTDNVSAISDLLSRTKVAIRFISGEQRVFLDGEDVSDLIRTPEISMLASRVSAIPQVRAFLLDMQRLFAETDNVLMDGRDIGTVVLPNATVKIFLTASAEERANRRYKELTEKGTAVSYDEVLADIKKRDYDDSHREIAPLKPAEDSEIVDTTGLEIEESLELLLKTIEKGIEGK